MNSRNRALALLIILNLAMATAILLELSDDGAVRTIMGKSMQHGGDRQLDILDSGDSFIMEPLGGSLMTYYEGLAEGHRVAGDWGDVIVFRTGGVRYVHRLVCYVEFNNTQEQVTADIPELGIYGVQEFGLQNYGHAKTDLLLDFPLIWDQMNYTGKTVTAGYITKGDNNMFVDQQRTTIPLVTKTNIEGMVMDVIDNELVLGSFKEIVVLLAMMGLAVGSYALWFRWKSDWPGRYLPPAVLTWCIIFLNLGFANSTKWVTGAERWAFMWLAFVPIIVYASILLLDRLEMNVYARAVLPMSGFALAYFLFAAGLHTYTYTILAISTVLCLHSLSPDRFFKGLAEWETDLVLGNWQICMGFAILLLISVFVTSLPMWFYLGIALVAGNAATVYALVRMRASKKPLESALQKVVT